YDDETASKLAQVALDATPNGGKIACVSSPSAFIKLAKLDYTSRSITPYVLEFDRRFNVYGSSFLFFDFNNAPSDLDVPGAPTHHQTFDTLIVDPPFLSDECWTKTSEAVRWLMKPGGRVIVCTGMVMERKVGLELGCRRTTFRPAHRGGRLANEFGCFSNYEGAGLVWE
ncbi:EEF1A lysine methyltransferase 1, partial [Dinochytrium kinnereticum]